MWRPVGTAQGVCEIQNKIQILEVHPYKSYLPPYLPLDVASLTHRRRIFTVRSLPVVDAKRRAGGVCCPKRRRPRWKRRERDQNSSAHKEVSSGCNPLGHLPSGMFIGCAVLQGTSNKQSLRTWTGARALVRGCPLRDVQQTVATLLDWHSGPRPRHGENGLAHGPSSGAQGKTDRHRGPRPKTWNGLGHQPHAGKMFGRGSGAGILKRARHKNTC